MEQAVVIRIGLTDAPFGSLQEREVLGTLEDQLEAAIEEAGAGEFDGDEFGEWECALYMYGPDADYLYAIIEPLLKSCSIAKGGYAIKRYGDASDPNADQIRVNWE